MPIQHKKEFGVYHWDTFDNETLLLKDADTLDEAEGFITERYREQGRIASSGADRVEIVDRSGTIKAAYPVC